MNASNKVQALAKRFDLFNRQLISFVEQCADADWRKVTKAEGWSVGVTAHHIGVMHYPLIEWVQLLVEGKEAPSVTMATIDEMNAQHAQANANCTPAEVIEILRSEGDKALAYLLTLGDEDLKRQGYLKVFDTTMSAGQFFTLAFIDYANDHLASMQATVAGQPMPEHKPDPL